MPRCPACAQENPASARFCMACGSPLGSGAEPRRKSATVLFCDIAGSTVLGERLDPEAVRELMVAYFVEMRSAIDAHGGTVEKFIGDAVVGVFGVPVAHEDDALRGVRAAWEMRERLALLNDDLDRRFGVRLSLRIGLNTGEVVTGDPAARDTFVSGDAVNVAARLEQSAGSGEVLLGETTLALVADAVGVEKLPPLPVKGKRESLSAYRLTRVDDVPERVRSRSSPFVGRERELALLISTIDLVRTSGEPARALVVGEPGVGKSRLVRAVLDQADVRVLSARCLSYGEDITYLPLVQLVRRAAAIRERDDVATAYGRIERMFGGVADAAAAAGILAQVLGLEGATASPEEIGWATRRMLEVLAAETTVVVLVDDLQWAEEPIVDVLAEMVARLRAPILVLCLARPEFLVSHPQWNAFVHLEPLAAADARGLVEHLAAEHRLTAESRDRLLAAAGGNPLFLEELVAFLAATGEETEFPPTLDALLNARLDALAAGERRALECAAIEGEHFHEGAVLSLASPDEPSVVEDALRQLNAAAVIRRAESLFEDDRGFQFRHLLVRDAAYRGTAKRRRADLHLRFADWLEAKLAVGVAELSEIVAYHLEQVCRLRADLGPLDEATRDVGARAVVLLSAAARRSLARGDSAAALGMFTRAVLLAPDDATAMEASLGRGIAAREASELALSASVLREVVRDADAAGLELVAARARLELALAELHLHPAAALAELEGTVDSALKTFAEVDDDQGRALGLFVRAQERWHALRLSDEGRLLERALVYAERAQDERLISSIVVSLARSVLFGPSPVSEAVPRVEELLARARRISPTTEATVTVMLATLEAVRGRARRARGLVRSSIVVLEERASPLSLARSLNWAGLVESTLGDPNRAERHLRRSFELHETLGERGVGSTAAALLARALVDGGNYEEGERFAAVALQWTSPGDIATQAYAHGARALALMARGAGDDACNEARTAVELSAGSDFANQRGNAFLDLASVLHTCGDDDGAREAASAAQRWFAVKGNTAAAERAAAFNAP